MLIDVGIVTLTFIGINIFKIIETVEDLMKDGPCQSLGEVRCEFDERKKFAEICESHDEIGHWVRSICNRAKPS